MSDLAKTIDPAAPVTGAPPAARGITPATNSASVICAQLARHSLAEVIDDILPHGATLAGDREQDAPRRKRKSLS